MTAAEALDQGYKIKELRLQHGYVSRKLTFEEAEVLEAKGRRKGQLYFLWPSYVRTRYCYRVYLEKL